MQVRRLPLDIPCAAARRGVRAARAQRLADGRQGGGEHLPDFSGADGGDGQQRVAQAVAGFAGALQEDRGPEARGRLHAVVAIDGEVAQVRGQRREHVAVGGAFVAGGQHGGVVAHGAFLARFAVVEGEVHAGGIGAGGPHFVLAQHAQAPAAGHALFVEGLEDLLDQFQVGDGVVGVGVFAQQRFALRAGAAEHVVGEFGVEDFVDEGAVVGGADGARTHHPVHLGCMGAALQVHEDFRGALPGPDQGDAARRALAGDVAQVSAGMEDARVALQAAEHFRDARGAAHADDEVARQALLHAAGRVARAHAQLLDHAVRAGLRQDLEHLLAVGALALELARGPAQVVVELVAAGVEALEVDEVLQPALLVQVVEEGEAALRVAQRGEILEEGDLHVRMVQQHVRMPREGRLALDEEGLRRAAVGGAVLFERDGQPHVGGAEADTDQVMDVLHGMTTPWK